jgi:thiol-disulfide isomerase/thioredoxin
MLSKKQSWILMIAILLLVIISAIFSYWSFKKNTKLVLSEKKLVKGNAYLPRQFLPIEVYEKINANKEIKKFLVKDEKNPVLIHFFASWCKPCEDELPNLMKLHNQIADKLGLDFYLISVDSSWQAIENFFKKKSINNLNSKHIKVYRIDEEELKKTYFETSKFPETFFVNSKGIITRKFIGAQNWTQYEVIDWVTKNSY